MTKRTLLVLLALAHAVAAGSAAAQSMNRALTAAPPVPLANPLLSDAEVRGQANAYLSAIDTPISGAAWRSLGPRGAAVLRDVFGDRANLPSRRAKALDGLAAFGDAQDASLFRAAAGAREEGLAVRFSALRGLARFADPGQSTASIQPLMETADDSRVRAYAALVMTRGNLAAACPAVRAQVQREAAGDAAHYQRALEACKGR